MWDFPASLGDDDRFLLVQLPDRGSAEALVMQGPYAQAGLYDILEAHPWRFGGRPSNS